MCVRVCTDLLFQLFDVDESGSVSYDELRLGLGKLGCVRVCEREFLGVGVWFLTHTQVNTHVLAPRPATSRTAAYTHTFIALM
jgi:hypothetical protein